MSISDISGIISFILLIALICMYTDIRNLNKTVKKLDTEIRDLKSNNRNA